jgi:hypothetical protein
VSGKVYQDTPGIEPDTSAPFAVVIVISPWYRGWQTPSVCACQASQARLRDTATKRHETIGKYRARQLCVLPISPISPVLLVRSPHFTVDCFFQKTDIGSAPDGRIISSAALKSWQISSSTTTVGGTGMYEGRLYLQYW